MGIVLFIFYAIVFYMVYVVVKHNVKVFISFLQQFLGFLSRILLIVSDNLEKELNSDNKSH